MRICMMEGPVDLAPEGATWEGIADRIGELAPDLLVTNEMPFGRWLAAFPSYDAALAAESVRVHEAGLEALVALNVPAIVSSRPVPAGARLANEAYALQGGRYTPLHQKQYFPEEPGFFEATWFHCAMDGFEVFEVGGIRLGVQLCTELMFNERARRYGRDGAELIVVPRASGASANRWLTAGAMAALVSGCYVVSSNRAGRTAQGQVFGGLAFAFQPDGEPLAQSSDSESIVTIEVDPARSRAQQALYPCYVRE
ncbi:carbon-nitrogen hydrolase family protein [Achromobacter deleyi]|uniref:carbon-nitrogen hydrolase family protein n=1 Tax=Achromobacter deleyi TaxID=1353891 RepID=UPI0014928099|nr:carbon-nitrogen hydrolase family protein [Achromobacter deleyi]QVQ25194.1 carbon-nitrogen hydrolase family protein [Achromobacter deleyi]UIP20735.1 carbon-nitrogen hydrolase family protein [Achromobacter deleyi]